MDYVLMWCLMLAAYSVAIVYAFAAISTRTASLTHVNVGAIEGS
jgi:hypothetical protein